VKLYKVTKITITVKELEGAKKNVYWKR